MSHSILTAALTLLSITVTTPPCLWRVSHHSALATRGYSYSQFTQVSSSGTAVLIIRAGLQREQSQSSSRTGMRSSLAKTHSSLCFPLEELLSFLIIFLQVTSSLNHELLEGKGQASFIFVFAVPWGIAVIQ